MLLHDFAAIELDRNGLCLLASQRLGSRMHDSCRRRWVRRSSGRVGLILCYSARRTRFS
jgi:hypothetical protein